LLEEVNHNEENIPALQSQEARGSWFPQADVNQSGSQGSQAAAGQWTQATDCFGSLKVNPQIAWDGHRSPPDALSAIDTPQKPVTDQARLPARTTARA
jgi:hypothetical protein